MFILGTILTSFIHALAYRLIHNQNFITDRSRCQTCNHVLSWYELIPILSYIFLKGRCKHCHSRISLLHPILEFIGGITLLLTYNYYGNHYSFYLATIILCIFLLSSLLDYYTLHVYTVLMYIYLILSLMIRYYTIGYTYLLFDILIFLIPFVIFYIFKKDMIGIIDIIMIVASSIMLGSLKEVFALLISNILAMLYYYILKYKNKQITYIPFVPFLSIGCVISMLFMDKILYYYTMIAFA